MTIVGFLKGCGVVLLYLVLSTTISFCSSLAVVLVTGKIRKCQKLPDAFYDGAVRWIFWSSIGIFVLMVIFGPYNFVQ